MKQFFSRKRSLVLALVGVLALSAGAVAYWTTTGGHAVGSASTGVSTAVTVAQATPLPTGIAPGASAKPIPFTLTNNATQNQYVNKVTVSITGVTKATGAPTGPCSTSDYVLSPANGIATIGQDMNPNQVINNDGTSVKILFNNTAASQDGCQGASVALAFDAG